MLIQFKILVHRKIANVNNNLMQVDKGTDIQIYNRLNMIEFANNLNQLKSRKKNKFQILQIIKRISKAFI